MVEKPVDKTGEKDVLFLNLEMNHMDSQKIRNKK